MKRITTLLVSRWLAPAWALGLCLSVSDAAAQNLGDYEHRSNGSDNDQWYDPTDWFDDDHDDRNEFESERPKDFGSDDFYYSDDYGYFEDDWSNDFDSDRYSYYEDDYGHGYNDYYVDGYNDDYRYGYEPDRDDYGWHDGRFDWQTDDEWYDDWYGDAHQDWQTSMNRSEINEQSRANRNNQNQQEVRE